MAVGRKLLSTLIGLLLAFSPPGFGQRPQSAPLVLEGGNLIDGTGAGVKPDHVIVIEGDRIRQVGPRGTLQYPAGARVMDMRGKFILPGLIDNHGHLRDWQTELFLAYGVTTVFDLGNIYHWTMALKRGIQTGEVRGPRLFCASWALDAPPFPGARMSLDRAGSAVYVSSVDEARGETRRLIAEGVDAIKVYERLSDEQLQAIAQEAHAARIPVVGHSLNILRSVPRGLDYVEHTYAVAVAASVNPERVEKQIRDLFPDPHYFGAPSIADIHASMDPNKYPQVIDFLVKNGAYINPTLLALWPAVDERKEAFVLENAQLLAWPELRYIPLDVRQNTLHHLETINVFQRLDAVAPAEQEKYRQGYAKVKDFLRRFVSAGGKVVAGVDAVTEILPGVGTHQEMEMLVGAGLTPLQAILSATRWSAEVMRIQDRVGTVEPGKFADLVILRDNPLEDIRNSRKIERVFIGGNEIDRGFHADYQVPIPRPTLPIVGTIDSIQPVRAPRASQSVSLVLRGQGFGKSSYVTFGGSPLRTTFESAQALRAVIPGELLSRVGTFAIEVVNPIPEGGTSTKAYFLVTYE